MTVESLIYKTLEESLAVAKMAPLILKIIAEECKRSGDGWCHLSFRDWGKKGITVWTLLRVVKWGKAKRIIQTKREAPESTVKGKGRGKKRLAYKLRLY